MGGGRVPNSSVSRLRLGPGAFCRMLIRRSIRQYRKLSYRHIPDRRKSSSRPCGFAQPEGYRAGQSRICRGVLAVCVAPPLSSLPSAIFYDEFSDVKADEYRRLQRMNTADFKPASAPGFSAHDQPGQPLISDILYYVICSNTGARRRAGIRRLITTDCIHGRRGVCGGLRSFVIDRTLNASVI